METLVTIIPKPEPGDWYFVTSSPESTNKIVVTIYKDGSVTQDTYHSYGKEYYFNPQKITKKEAQKFLKKTILEIKEKTDLNSADKVMLECMIRFYKSFFHENLGLPEA